MFLSPPRLSPAEPGSFLNWGRNQEARPANWARPETSAEVASALNAPAPVRVVGAGHSFTPIVETEGTIISLDGLTGLISVDSSAGTAWIKAGTRLRDASRALAEHGLAFRNLGDIDAQSIAGATATATHGTGASLPCLSAELKAVRLIVASGEEITIGEDDPRLGAAQVSLGALGVITAVKVAVVPRYKLHRKVWIEPIEDILAQAEARWEKHRNYEFMAVPFSGYGVNISHDLTEVPETERAPSDDDASVMLARLLQRLLGRAPRLRRALIGRVMRGMPPEDTVGESWKLLASDRNVPFTEMEYHLPEGDALEVFQEVLSRIERDRNDVFFPIEVRKTAGDTAWLSPFQGAGRVSVAVHAYYSAANDWFETLAEPVFLEAGGRPHWGKIHCLEAPELAPLYPDFERFLNLRAQMDPEGRFVTPALARLWGL